MGQTTRIERCHRFMGEFGPDAVRKVNIISPVEVVHQDLVFIEGEDSVRYGITLRDADGQEWEFVSDNVWFDPEEAFEEDTVDRVATLLSEPEYHTALRLKRADLLKKNPEDWHEESGGDASTGSDVPGAGSCERDGAEGEAPESG